MIEDNNIKLIHKTNFGRLYQGDCLKFMRRLKSNCIDLIFADPPFNLNKMYPSKIDDNLKEKQYINWCKEWIFECTRILKPGGSIFIWNLPKWNIINANFLNSFLTFRHWISVDMRYSFPIKGRLYPSHYSLLYYCKGEKPNTFTPDRFPMPICQHCFKDLKDYGGYKYKMNPKGITLPDVWLDIHPVRHNKYKKRKGCNELPLKLMDRIIEMASKKGDIIFDPFGGSGTTYAVSEIKGRKWVGIELGPTNIIINRLKNLTDETKFITSIRTNYNCLFTNKTLKARKKKGLWIKT